MQPESVQQDPSTSANAAPGEVATPSAMNSLSRGIQAICLLGALYFAGSAVFGGFKIGDNSLEKALQLGKSTRADFSAFSENGGLDNADQSTWDGYDVSSISLGYDKAGALASFTMQVSKSGMSGKVASLNNLKSSLASMCSGEWKANGRAYFAESAASLCGVIESSSSGKVEITVASKGG